REMRVDLTRRDAVRRLADRTRLPRLEIAEPGIGFGRRSLDQAERANEFARHREPGNREVVDRALSLRAIQRIGRDAQLAHAVTLGSVGAHEFPSTADRRCAGL